MSDLLKSFNEFESVRPKTIKCTICKLPRDVVDAVDILIRQKRNYKVIAEWLVGLGFPQVSRTIVDNHKRNGHVPKVEDE